MHVLQVFHTRTEPHTFAGFNHEHYVQIYIVYRDHPLFKRSIICIWTALTARAETLAIIKWSKEARSWTEICTCCACISILFAISEGNFCPARLRSSKSGWRHWSDRNDLKGQDTPCGQCRHRVREGILRAFKCWWSPSSVRWFSVSSSTSLRASMVCALATHQIRTNG